MFVSRDTVWKRVIYQGKDLGDYYLVSNTGEIKGVKTGKIRKKNISHEGYYYVSISLGSRADKPMLKVHRAVAETFLINENDYPVINHKDGNKLNNNLENLEFCTYQYNTIHAYKNGLTSRNKPVICLNTGDSFCSMGEAAKWAGLKDSYSLKEYFKKENRMTCGRHPVTNEKLKWKTSS